MRRLCCCVLSDACVLSAARAESVLRTMITTDIRGLMPGNSPDDNTGLVLQQIYEGLVAWRSDGTVAQRLWQREREPDHRAGWLVVMAERVA